MNTEIEAPIRLLTETEAAKIIGVHPGTMHNWRRWNLGPPFTKVRRGGRWVIRYPADDLRVWLMEKKKKKKAN